MKPIAPIWDYVEADYTDLPFFLIEKLPESAYNLFNSEYSNERVLKQNGKEIKDWYRIKNNTYGSCFEESGECVLCIQGNYWWGIEESEFGIGALRLWNILTEIKNHNKMLCESDTETDF